MEQPKSPRPPGPPHNPWVRDLVAGKRRYSSPPRREDSLLGFLGWHEAGRLPHRDEPNIKQFVTFHLADSFPETLRFEWQLLLRIEDDRRRRAELEAYLDKGHGAAYLRKREIAGLTEGALRLFHGTRYELLSWVIMSNHVHVLFKVESVPMFRIVESWKKYTANRANHILGRRGRFWAADYYDTFIRDQEHESRTIRYIENNPVKARLVLEPREWPWSSARLRDQYGRLCL